MARGQGVNPFGIPTNAEPIDMKGGSVTQTWRLFFSRIAANLIKSLVAGPNGSVQYNDNGVQAGDANLTWDKVTRQEVATGSAGASSPIVARTDGVSPGEVALTPGDVEFNDILLGGHQDESGNFIPNGDILTDIFQTDNSATGDRRAGTELSYGLTPDAPDPLTKAVGYKIVAPTDTSGGDDVSAFHAYEYGGLGAGAVPGMAIGADRNTSGTGAASTIFGQLKDGRFFVFWVDNTGAPRWNVGATLAAIRPTESGSVSDTGGNLFGSGSSATNITQLFTRRGEEGRSGIPGLPGSPGATGSTGATGPAGADGIIISRRADEGRAGIPGINGAAGVAGATGPAGQSAPVISRRGDDGRMGNPGPTGPTGATAATTRAITFAIDGGGSVLTTGVKAEQTIPYGCTITANTVLADQSGSVALDIKKTTFAGFPGSLASIVASAPPTLSSAQKSTDSTLTSWTTTINAGDVLQWTVSSVTTVTRVNCTLTVTA